MSDYNSFQPLADKLLLTTGEEVSFTGLFTGENGAPQLGASSFGFDMKWKGRLNILEGDVDGKGISIKLPNTLGKKYRLYLSSLRTNLIGVSIEDIQVELLII